MNTQQMIKLSPLYLLGLFGLSLFASPVAAQVFESGPSAPEMFDSFLSLPIDQNISNLQSAGGDELTTRINVSIGGSIGNSFDALSGTEINVSGGVIGIVFDAFDGSEINITGGIVGGSFDANDGSEVNISGGSVGASFDAFSGSVVNISGGTIGDDFDALAGSQINLFGSDFALDDVLIDEEQLSDEPFTIEKRDVTLSGTYADGTEFSFDLKSEFENGEDFFSTDATLTVTLGPPSDTIIIVFGDVNQDTVVNFLDIATFIQLMASDSFIEQGDFNQDGKVNFLDIQPFINILTGN